MVSVKSKPYTELYKLSGKNVHFKSDCEFFPNFDVRGKVIGTSVRPNELVFKFKTTSGKTIQIGSNMKNLRYEIIKSKS